MTMSEKPKNITLPELAQMLIGIQRNLERTRLNAIRDKQSYKDMEAEIWLSTDFKAVGATNEKMRNAYVREQLYKICPPTYLQKEGKIQNLESRKEVIETIIDVMIDCDIQEYPFEGLDFGKDKLER